MKREIINKWFEEYVRNMRLSDRLDIKIDRETDPEKKAKLEKRNECFVMKALGIGYCLESIGYYVKCTGFDENDLGVYELCRR